MLYDLHTFVLYSLRTALCLALFYLFFKWVLSRDTLHRLNRVVLLTAVVVAFLLPVCRVTIVEVVPAPEPMPILDELPMEEIVTTLPDDGIAWQQVVGALFLLAMAVMVGRMALATFSVWRTIHRLKRSAEEVREVEGSAPFALIFHILPLRFSHIAVTIAVFSRTKPVIVRTTFSRTKPVIVRATFSRTKPVIVRATDFSA